MVVLIWGTQFRNGNGSVGLRSGMRMVLLDSDSGVEEETSQWPPKK